MPRYASMHERLIANTHEPENEQACWVWKGKRDRWGYGRLNTWVKGRTKTLMAHITMWRLLIGPVPEGMELDHLCHNEACINPDHLEPVTPKENCRRRDEAINKFAKNFIK